VSVGFNQVFMKTRRIDFVCLRRSFARLSCASLSDGHLTFHTYSGLFKCVSQRDKDQGFQSLSDGVVTSRLHAGHPMKQSLGELSPHLHGRFGSVDISDCIQLAVSVNKKDGGGISSSKPFLDPVLSFRKSYTSLFSLYFCSK
jgi:hypothetical protein